YNHYLDRMRHANQGRQSQYRSALTYFSDPSLQKRTLDYAMSTEVRSQDLPRIIAGLLTRPSSSHDTWNFVKANWDALQRTGVFQGVPAIVESTTSFCDEATRNDVASFFETHERKALDRHVRQSLETIDRCIQLRTQQKQNLTAFLRGTVN